MYNSKLGTEKCKLVVNNFILNKDKMVYRNHILLLVESITDYPE